jgi:hypothetical protein
MIKIDFELSRDGYSFKDAIVLPVDHGFTEAQIEEMKQKRFDDWYAIVTAPALEPIAPEGFEFVLDAFNVIVRDENGEPVLVAIGEE